jgi:hypothetical protein
VSSDKGILPPKREKADTIDSVIETAISAIPYLGGPATRLFNLVITPPLERRLNEWRNTVAERILQLKEKVEGFKVEDLGKNPMFITTVMQATQIALRTHQKKKLEALQNAVVNTARGIALQEDLQLLFLNLVDSFTTLHLRILKFLDDPRLPAEEETAVFLTKSPDETSLGDLLEIALPELKGQSSVCNPIVQDLFNRGLLKIDSSGLVRALGPRWGEMWGQTLFKSRTTDLGKNFLRYIAS